MKDTLVRYVRALSSAFKFIRNAALRAEVIKTIVDTTGFSEANAKLTMALYFEPERNVIPRLGEISMTGMQASIDMMGEAGVLKAPLPPAAFDTGYGDAYKSGFQKLWGL